MVDDDLFELLNQFKWFAHKDGRNYYANRSISKNKKVQMHRQILGDIPHGKQVDHINGNGLDNRRENLRVVTQRENCQNKHITKTSRYIGVRRDHKNKVWTAQINFKNKVIHLGVFISEISAAHAYRNACLSYGLEYIGPIPPAVNHHLEV